MSKLSSIDNETLGKNSTEQYRISILPHTLPTNFFKCVFHFLTADVPKIVVVSLLSGIFPKSLKIDVRKPLLKKNNLDAFP